jgi:hypothetical protein
VIQLVSAGGGDVAVFAVGQEAKGFIAIGQLATGVIAIGQEATGVIAIGQLARGVIAIGQVALGIVAIGMGAVGVLWCSALIGISGTSGPGLLVYGLLGRVRLRQWPLRMLALVRNEPWDSTRRWPAWRRVLGIILLPVLAALWWFLAGHTAIATTSWTVH